MDQAHDMEDQRGMNTYLWVRYQLLAFEILTKSFQTSDSPVGAWSAYFFIYSIHLS